MKATPKQQPQPVHGYTMQFLTLARALALALDAMEDDMDALSRENRGIWACSLRMEARFTTIALLSASLCESIANTILALSHHSDVFEKLERKPPLEKWHHLVPEALQCDPFIDDSLSKDLTLLVLLRNSITHAKATVFSSETDIRPNPDDPWNQLTPETIRRLALIPVSLANAVPVSIGSNPIVFSLCHSVKEHQLMRALNRQTQETNHDHGISIA